MDRTHNAGFTLLELSIVLVIIGLIVGGALVGKDLIDAAAIRAEISQIEKYNTAVNTFRVKYDALPGDMNANTAAAFGFAPRGQYAGEGDGNGILEGITANGPGQDGPVWETGGETTMFWSDLTYANGTNVNLIEGSYSAASETIPVASITGTLLDAYFPAAKIGMGNYIYVYNDYHNRLNYYALAVPGAACGAPDCIRNGDTATYPGITAAQAFAIDSKIDDGLPQWGRVLTQLVNNWGIVCPKGGPPGSFGASGGDWENCSPTTAATAGSSVTCYDNGGIAVAAQHYSTEINGGTGVNLRCRFSLGVTRGARH